MAITFVRKAWRHCQQFVSGYRLGLEGPLLDFAMKKYTSHRRMSDGLLDDVNVVTSVTTAFEAYRASKGYKRLA